MWVPAPSLRCGWRWRLFGAFAPEQVGSLCPPNHSPAPAPAAAAVRSAPAPPLPCRNLLDTLEDPNEDLLLEYHAAAPSSSTDSGDVAAAAAANIAPAGPALAAVVAAA
jgi:hypothetical protein